MKSQQDLYNELSYYTLEHHNPNFVHQHIVDAFTAQNADKNTKNIAITFALVGLYLFLEKNFTGKEVQKIHMKMAKKKRKWPKFELPEKRGEITVSDVLKTNSGKFRDEMIKKWCASVWETFDENHEKVAKLLEDYLI